MPKLSSPRFLFGLNMLINVGCCGTSLPTLPARAVLDVLPHDIKALLLVSLSELCSSSFTVLKEEREIISVASRSDLYPSRLLTILEDTAGELILIAPARTELSSDGALSVFKFEFRLLAPPTPGLLPPAVERAWLVMGRGVVLMTRERGHTKPARMAGMQAQKMAVVI